MTDDLCPREPEVLHAGESGEWAPALRAHLTTCEACREVEAVSRVLRAAVADEAVPLATTADDIWWRAQLLARQQARARVMRPLDTIERAEPLMVLVAVAALLVLRGEEVATRLFAWATSEGTGQALQVLMPPALMPLLLVAACLGGLVLLVGIGAVVASD